MISERTTAALAHKKRNGEHVGLPPYGFRIGAAGRLEEKPEELKAIQRMKRMKREGLSYQAIADKLNAKGVKARCAQWGKTSVSRLVRDDLRTRKARYLNGLNGRSVS